MNRAGIPQHERAVVLDKHGTLCTHPPLTPRASFRQWGANRPENAGTKYLSAGWITAHRRQPRREPVSCHAQSLRLICSGTQTTTQPREPSNVHSTVVRHRPCKCLHLGRVRDDVEVVTQPLNQRASNSHRALKPVHCRLCRQQTKSVGKSGAWPQQTKSVGASGACPGLVFVLFCAWHAQSHVLTYRIANFVRDSRQHAVLAEDNVGACVAQQETTRSCVCVCVCVCVWVSVG